jgi:hypothetical protein
MTEINGNRRIAGDGSSVIDGKISGGILVTWFGVSFFLKEMSLINGHLWWPVFAAGIGVLLIMRGVMIYENTKYWSNDKGAFIGGAFFILLSLLSFVNFGYLANFWPVIIVFLAFYLTTNENSSSSERIVQIETESYPSSRHSAPFSRAHVTE